MRSGSRTPYTILGCLTVEPMSGYDVKRYLEQTVAHFWSESYGQIYPALRRLEEEGLVEGRSEPGERGQDKRVFRITDAGRRQLEAWLRLPAAPVRPRYEHSLKLFFGHNVGPQASLEHVERLRREAEENLARYETWEKRLRQRTRQETASPEVYYLAVLRGGVHYSRMMLDWCDESAQALRELQEHADSGRAEARPAAGEEDR